MDNAIDEYKKNLRDAYKKADQRGKKNLQKFFNKEALEGDIFDRIQSLEDVYKICKERPVINKTDTEDEVAYKILKLVVKAYNGDWEADFNNPNQPKWEPVFNMKGGFGFSRSSAGYGYDFAIIGARLCYRDKKTCDTAVTKFLSIYKQYLTK